MKFLLKTIPLIAVAILISFIGKAADSCGKITFHPRPVKELMGNPCNFKAISTMKDAQYRWQVDNGAGFKNLNDGGAYTGTHTQDFKVFASTRILSGEKYRCIVTNKLGCADTTTTALLTIAPDEAPVLSAETIIITPEEIKDVSRVMLPGNYFGTMELIDNLGRVVAKKDLRMSMTYVEFSTVLPGYYTAKFTINDVAYFKRVHLVHTYRSPEELNKH